MKHIFEWNLLLKCSMDNTFDLNRKHMKELMNCLQEAETKIKAVHVLQFRSQK